jgi:4,5:9,10-diseco-3-hydroxy-5,9,17-trioxoandrosta-1(10),2-diene-4-oate hydrolase
MNLDAEKVLGRFAQAGAVRIHYGEAGAGPPVICLHGTGPGADAWANFRLNAGALADRHRTLLVDLPRFGRSEKVVVKGPRLDYL